jgi:hypothetical protein
MCGSFFAHICLTASSCGLVLCACVVCVGTEYCHSEGGRHTRSQGREKKKGSTASANFNSTTKGVVGASTIIIGSKATPVPLPIVGWPSLAAPFSYLILFNSPPLLLPFSFGITHLWQNLVSIIYPISPDDEGGKKTFKTILPFNP